MLEYHVKLRGGGYAYVYAHTYVVLGGLYQFYEGDRVIIQFEASQVVAVQQTVPEGGGVRQ